MKSLVTGGAGFIGSHLVDRLIEIGHEVIVIDNLSANNDEFYFNDKAKYYELDVCDYNATHHLYDGVDYVFHLAAESRLQQAIENPMQAVMKNSFGTCVVLQCSRNAGVKKVIYSSTSSAYGNNEVPNVETQRNDPLNPYSASKVSGEELCKMYTDLYGLKTIIFRYFNVFGERSPRKGPYALVLGIFFRQKENNESLTIVGDGKQQRDFVHVSDVVKANIMAAEKNIDDEYYGNVYNVGTAKKTSVMEVAAEICNDHIFINPRSGEMKVTFANIDKIKKVFGWEPSINILDWIREVNVNL